MRKPRILGFTCLLVILPSLAQALQLDSAAVRRLNEYRRNAEITSKLVLVTLPDSASVLAEEFPDLKTSLDSRRDWVASRMGVRLSETVFWQEVENKNVARLVHKREVALSSQRLLGSLMLIGSSFAYNESIKLNAHENDSVVRSQVALFAAGVVLSSAGSYLIYDAFLKGRSRLSSYAIAKLAAEQHNNRLILEINTRFKL